MKKNKKYIESLLPLKKYKSAYLYFCLENRDKYINDNPGVSSIDITKLLGKEWKNLDNKEPYYLLEQKDKEKFNETKIHHKYTYKKSNKLKKPKRFRTAFMLFLKDQKEGIKKNKDVIGSLKEIGRRWKLLIMEERQEYINQENDDKIRYKNEYLDYIDKVMKHKETKDLKKEKILQLLKDIPKIFKSNSDIVNKLSVGLNKKIEIKDKNNDDNDIEQLIANILKDNNSYFQKVKTNKLNIKIWNNYYNIQINKAIQYYNIVRNTSDNLINKNNHNYG